MATSKGAQDSRDARYGRRHERGGDTDVDPA
jgi:hypothetical protein